MWSPHSPLSTFFSLYLTTNKPHSLSSISLSLSSSSIHQHSLKAKTISALKYTKRSSFSGKESSFLSLFYYIFYDSSRFSFKFNFHSLIFQFYTWPFFDVYMSMINHGDVLMYICMYVCMMNWWWCIWCRCMFDMYVWSNRCFCFIHEVHHCFCSPIFPTNFSIDWVDKWSVCYRKKKIQLKVFMDL